MRAGRRLWQLWVVVFVLVLPLRSGAVPSDADELGEWWDGAGQFWLGDTAYEASGHILDDGLCRASFDEGVLIPVHSGDDWQSSRIVGLVFVGTGQLEVSFSSRADAWRYANHRVVNMGEPASRWESVANQEEPYRVSFDRTLVMSGDRDVRHLLENLSPIGSGMILRESEEGVMGEYVIADQDRRVAARMISTNLLPNRRRHLERAGLNLQAMVRQDRFLTEELGVPGSELRMLADFRTEDRQGIAALRGSVLGTNDYDRWLTCFRDGMDMSQTGFESMVFAMGTDSEGFRHFERFAGEPFHAPIAAPHMEPVHAEVSASAVPQRRGTFRVAEVESTLRLEAVGGPVRYIGLSLPVSGEISQWDITTLEIVDGPSLAWVGLTEGLAGSNFRLASQQRTSDEASAEEDFESEENEDVSIDTNLGEGGREASSTPENPDTSSRFDADEVDRAAADRRLVPGALQWYQVLVVLPETVEEGEEIEINLNWTARWQFANWTAERQMLGPGTGPQPFLPDLFPQSGGTAWDYEVSFGIPSSGFRPTAVALSGDTEEDWVDESAWIWTRAQGQDEIRPAVALGRWYSLMNPGGDETPAVRVHLFGNTAQFLTEFGPEVRRVVSYLDRFLPEFPISEIDVYQGSSVLPSEGLVSGFREAQPGMIGIERVRVNSVGAASVMEDEDPHMAQTMVARQIAHQYWGQQLAPATGRDAWMVSALSDAYASFYVRSAFGSLAYSDRMQGLREAVEDPTEYRATEGQLNRERRPLSLTGSTRFSDISGKLRSDYGAYVMADMIRLRIGDYAYFYALDRLARRIGSVPDSRVSTDDLQAAFEETSGQDLSDFFDYWVHGGFIPEIELWLSHVEGEEPGVQGCIETNIPFGRMDVPVELTDQEGERTVAALVDIIDGRGSFWVPDRTEDVEVELDPLGLSMAYSRTVRWEDHARCDLVDMVELDSVPVEEILEGVDEPGAEASDESSSTESVEPSTDTEAAVEESTSE